MFTRISNGFRGIGGLGATPAQLAAAMAAVESGGSPSALSLRNNNPLNLIYVGQAGATLGEGGFAKFPDYNTGMQAGLNQINLDLTRGASITGAPTTTLAELIAAWSPAGAPGNSQASTQAYVQSVAGATGIDPNAPLSSQLQSAYSTNPQSGQDSSQINAGGAAGGLDLSFLPTGDGSASEGLFLALLLGAGALVWALSE